jgi:hypothetical protein
MRGSINGNGHLLIPVLVLHYKPVVQPIEVTAKLNERKDSTHMHRKMAACYKNNDDDTSYFTQQLK